MKNLIKERVWRRTIHLFKSASLKSKRPSSLDGREISFHKRMEKVLPDLKRYISKYLNDAVERRIIPSGRYKVEDLADDLYIMAYDHMVLAREDVNLYNWLLEKAKELIDDTIIEVDFNQTFFKNIDNYTKAERAEMEERLYVDANGELILQEDLEDYSYPKIDHILNTAFIEDSGFKN